MKVELEAAVRSKETLSLELESLKTAFSLKDQRIAELVIFLFHFSLGFKASELENICKIFGKPGRHGYCFLSESALEV